MQRRIVSGYSVTVITVLQSCVAPRRRSYSRAREVTEQLYEIIGPGDSVILTASGHRVDLGRTQDITMDLYLLSGEDGNYRDYHYGILQSRKMNFNYLCFNFGPFLTKVTTRTPTFLRDYKWGKAKKRHPYS